METATADEATLLKRAAGGVRGIYCTQITACDILPLINKGEKLATFTLDGIATKYQEISEENGNTHWAVLSGWFGPLVGGTVKEGRQSISTKQYVTQIASDSDCMRKSDWEH
ncbi:hypothetical protein AX16_009991 [Volvariella volvacea WC 439]|nr:hypothetical protein AX16_009991 [Volvariella volvacea WC 439]